MYNTINFSAINSSHLKFSAVHVVTLHNINKSLSNIQHIYSDTHVVNVKENQNYVHLEINLYFVHFQVSKVARSEPNVGKSHWEGSIFFWNCGFNTHFEL